MSLADDEADYCPQCSGSGEGMHDGSTCSACKGRGHVIDQKQDEIAQAWAERRQEQQHDDY
jgi:DnaJ-class molecular chaperone